MEKEPVRSVELGRRTGRERVDAREADESVRLRASELRNALVRDVISVSACPPRADDRAVDAGVVERLDKTVVGERE